MSVLNRALFVFLIALLCVSAPLHAADASGRFVIRDEASCLLFGKRNVGITSDTTLTTHWDSNTSKCHTDKDDHLYFDLPRDLLTNCSTHCNGGGVQFNSVEIAAGVTMVTTPLNWELKDGGRVINRGRIEIKSRRDISGGFISDRSRLGSGTIENHGSLELEAARYEFSGTLTNEDEGGDPLGTAVLIQGEFSSDGTIHNNAFFDMFGSHFSSNGSFLNDERGTLRNAATFQNHQRFSHLFGSWVERGDFENRGTILNAGIFDFRQSPMRFEKGTFDSSREAGAGFPFVTSAGEVWWDGASGAATFTAGTKTGPIKLINAGMVDIRQNVVIGATGSLEIGAGTTLRVRSGAQLANSGAVLNRGYLQVAGGIGIVNQVGARISNHARALIGQGGSLANDGIFDNIQGAALTIAGPFANGGALNNQGAIDVICPGTITANPVSGNAPRPTPCAPVITSAVLADPRQFPGFFPPIHGDFHFNDFAPFASGLYATNTPTITGTADPAFGGGQPLSVTLYGSHVVGDGPAVIGSAVTDSAGQWSVVASPLSYGFHRLHVTATNAQGQTSDHSPNQFIGITLADMSDPLSCDPSDAAWSGDWDPETRTCTIKAFFDGRADDVVLIPSGVTLDFRAWGVEHNGTLINRGTFRNERGFLMNRGRIDNFGTFANVGSFANQFAPLGREGYLENRTGTINNFEGATLSVENLAKLSNRATLNNHGSIDILSGGLGDGSVVNETGAALNNFDVIHNQGLLDNTSGTIVQFCAASVTGNPIIGEPPLYGPCAPAIASISSGTTPTIAGTAEPHVLVGVFLLADGVLTRVGSTAATSSGTWSLVTVAPLPAGRHALVAMADSDVGRSVLSDSVELVVVLPPPNTAPALTAPASQSAAEGVNTAFALGQFTDADTDSPWAVNVSWGDASAPSNLSSSSTGVLPVASHTFADNGVYTVTVTVTDTNGAVDSEGFQVTVENAAPTVTAPADATIAEGGTFTATGSILDPGADTWTMTVDYGDGTPGAVVELSADRSFALEHTYADEGRYPITLTVTDDDGGAGSGTLAVTVHNVAPALSSLDALPNLADEGSAVLLSVAFTDPGSADAHTARWSFGDGSSSTQQLAAVGVRTASIQQRYADDGVYTVAVAVDDGDGGTSELREIDVQVLNVAPRFEPSLGPRSVAEGRTLRFEVRAADASSLDELTLGASGLPPRAAFLGGRDVGVVAAIFEWTPACDQAGDHLLTFRVQDDEGGVSEESVTLSVTEACAAVVAVANEGDDSVAIVDAESQQLLDLVAVGRKPAALTFGGSAESRGDEPRLYVTGRSSGHAGAEDGGDDEADDHNQASEGRGIVAVLSRIPDGGSGGGRFDWAGIVDVGERPIGVALTPDGTQLWVAHRNEDSVGIVDTATERSLGVVQLRVPRLDKRGRQAGWTSLGRRPLALAFSPDGAFAYVIAEESNALLVLDRARALADPAGAILASLLVGTKPAALAVHPAGGLVYVATREGLAVADVSTPTAPVLRGVQSLSLRRDGSERRDRDDDDGRGKQPAKHVLSGLALASGGGVLYVTDAREDVLWAIAIQPSPEYLSIVGFVPVGRRPAGVAVTPAGSRAAGDLIYVANTKDRTVSVIDSASRQVVATVAVGRRPIGVAAAIVATQP